MPLSVVHFSTCDADGGSARSATRIHKGLSRLGHKSRMLVGKKETFNPDVATVWPRLRYKLADKVVSSITDRLLGWQYAYLPSSQVLPTHPWVRNADIIQLYNTHGGYFSHSALPELSRIAPLVWRLSDLWPITGHCSYPGNCHKWETGCGGCPDISLYPSLPRDTTAMLWRMKNRWYNNSRLTIVAPSSWTQKAAQKSPLFKNFEIVKIPNGIDTDVFQPINREESRKLLGLPAQEKIILFVAHGLDQNMRKGIDLLPQILSPLYEKFKIRLLVAGVGKADWCDDLPCKVIRLGYLQDDRLLVATYSAANVVLVPSKADNLPNVALESMACGIPVAAFNVGGMKDAVRDGENGCLADPGNLKDLISGVANILDRQDIADFFSRSGRTLIENEFSSSVQARRFEALYHKVLTE